MAQLLCDAASLAACVGSHGMVLGSVTVVVKLAIQTYAIHENSGKILYSTDFTQLSFHFYSTQLDLIVE